MALRCEVLAFASDTEAAAAIDILHGMLIPFAAQAGYMTKIDAKGQSELVPKVLGTDRPDLPGTTRWAHVHRAADGTWYIKSPDQHPAFNPYRWRALYDQQQGRPDFTPMDMPDHWFDGNRDLLPYTGQ